MAESDNHMQWQKQPGHYEVWYLTLNHRASDIGLWIRYTMEAPVAAHGDPYCQLWFAAFDAREPRRSFALNHKLPITELASRTEPFELRMGEAWLRHGAASGGIAGGGHEARWALEWTPPAQAHHHLPSLIYRTDFADTKVLSPDLQARFRGSITLDDREITLDGEPGCQTHVWGRKHAYQWAWSHASAFEGHPDAALETLTVRLKRGALVLPPISLLSLYLDGEAFHFRELYQAPLVRGHFETGAYRLTAHGLDVRIEAEYRCRPEDLVLTPYTDPDGEAVFCHNTEIADCRVLVSRRQGLSFRGTAELLAPRRGHFEYGGRAPDLAVTRRHVTV